MIGKIITDPKTGEPIDSHGERLSPSSYQAPPEVMKLWARVQLDYQTAWALQHRSFQEFDGYSLLQRARLDQQTFSAYVGCEYVASHKQWRWKGRKNTARNKLIGILAHMLSGMLYPFVYAKNEENEEDKMTARVMRILVEEHLRKADYEIKFLYMCLSALVNPAVFIEVEYVEAMQLIKERLKDGTIKITEAIDELLSGLNLNIIPVDELLLADFYTGNIQRQPYIIRVRRLPYDTARKIYSGKYFAKDGTDLFDYVQAGRTRIVLAGQENQTLYDIEWTEADRDYVQEVTIFYRDEDLQVTWVGGTFMGNEKDVYNSNPFKHRRFTLIGNEWKSIPIYPFAKSGFEPLDVTGRFAYFKSGAFKEYWDDASQNRMYQLAHDGTYLDVIKPLFMSGMATTNSVVIAPGATVGMPQGATVTPYQLGPNLSAALNLMNVNKEDMSESTQDKIMSGSVEKGVTAYATSKAEQNARVFLGVFGTMIADLIRQVGELTMDCIIQHQTIGELDNSVPEALKMKYKTFLSEGKERGKTVTNRIVFTDKFMGRKMSENEVNDYEWKLFDKAGGVETDQRIFEVNPYKFARYTYSMWVDADKIIMKSMGTDKQEKVLAFNMMTDPRVAPYTDQKAVVNDFVIEEYGGDDPDKYKLKAETNQLLRGVVGGSEGSGGQENTGQNPNPSQYKLGQNKVVPAVNTMANVS